MSNHHNNINKDKYKAGFVSLVGATNAGKSTLFNRLTNSDLAIITKREQTTRELIDGVLTTSDYQIIFIDTPGYNHTKGLLADFMLAQTIKSLQKSDLFVLVSSPDKSSEEDLLLERLPPFKTPLLLVLNKVDSCQNDKLEKKIAYLNEKLTFIKILKLSATLDDDFDELLKIISSILPVRPPIFDQSTFTNRNLRFLVAEFIREAAMKICYQEIPYRIAVQTQEYKKLAKITKITAYLYVDKKNSQAILVGTNGRMIKKIGTSARQRIEGFLGQRVFLELSVKVLHNWHQDQLKLKFLGYS
ncbi:MAG: GTPase Era [SAR324 cluster bacterium]|nr:GTPase Era [SAR324 cluster bacterium]